MKVIAHTEGVEPDTFMQYHDVTLRFSKDELYDVIGNIDRPSGLDFDTEFTNAYGQELMRIVVLPLGRNKEIV